MKTIEERAKEYADRLKSAEIGDFGVATVYGYKDVYNANMAAYKRGATEQKAIDIDKACEWLKERVQCGVHPQRAYGFAEEFRKGMEE